MQRQVSEILRLPKRYSCAVGGFEVSDAGTRCQSFVESIPRQGEGALPGRQQVDAFLKRKKESSIKGALSVQ